MKSLEKVSVAVVLSASLLSTCPAGVWAASTEVATEAAETERSSSDTHDFKSFDWGMTQKEIEAVEGTPDQDGEMSTVNSNYIAYTDKSICGKDAILAYYFTDDQFYEARYILTEEHSNDNLYIDDYSEIKKYLTESFGDPYYDFTNWDTDSHEDYYAGREGDALSYGYLTYTAWFSTDNLEVFMNMSADNYKISTTIQFQSKTIEPGEKDFSGSDW